jgi:nitrate reductase NapE component
MENYDNGLLQLLPTMAFFVGGFAFIGWMFGL